MFLSLRRCTLIFSHNSWFHIRKWWFCRIDCVIGFCKITFRALFGQFKGCRPSKFYGVTPFSRIWRHAQSCVSLVGVCCIILRCEITVKAVAPITQNWHRNFLNSFFTERGILHFFHAEPWRKPLIDYWCRFWHMHDRGWILRAL